jgi:hypothetical protein
MSASDEIPTLLATARANAVDLTKPVPEIEAEIFDLVSTFEARLQHHFKRGPFFKKLRALLVESDNTTLADSVHHYAQAVNVLKHGTGASYRELKSADDLPFKLHIPAGNIRLIDVAKGGFYAGLVDTLDQAHAFLISR